MSEARQLFMEVSLAAQKQNFSEVEALNTFRGPQGLRGEPGSIDNLVINGKEAVPVDGKNTINLTPADVGALGKNEKAVDADKLNGKDAVYYLGARNLLDNSDCEIAQAGYNGYHGNDLYHADRWIGNGNGLLSISDGVKTFTSNSGFAIMRQNLWNDGRDHGKTYTLVITLPDGNRLVKSGTSPTTPSTSDQVFIEIIAPDSRCWAMAMKIADDVMCVRIDASQVGASISFLSIDLYEGEYTAESAPPHAQKGYAAELAECQRYFVAYDTYGNYGLAFGTGSMFSVNTGRIAVQLPGAMVKTPSVGTTDTVNTIFHSGGSKFDNPTLSVLSQSGSKVILQVGLGAGETVKAYDTFGLGFTSSDSTKKGYIYFSADL